MKMSEESSITRSSCNGVTKSLQTAFECESIVRRIVSEQAETGVLFNERRANRYISWIAGKKEQLYNQIRPLLQLEVIRTHNVPVNKPFKENGDYSASALGWFGSRVNDVSGQFSRVRFEEPDIGSRKKLQSQLIRLGWKPRHFTEKGSPKLTYD